MISSINNLVNIISSSPVSIAVLDKKMHYLAVSQKWVEGYNLKERDFIGHSHYELFPEIGKEWKSLHADCLKGNSHSKREDMFIRSDGSVQWINWDISPWKADNGDVGGMIMYSEDVTSCISENKDLQRNLRLYKDTNEAALIGSWEIDLADQSVFWSPMIRQILELESDYLPEGINSMLFLQKGKNKTLLNKIVKGAREQCISFDEVMEIQTLKGNKTWVKIRGNAESKDGRCVRVFGTIQDIQSLKHQGLLLADSEQKYKSIIENSLNPHFLIRTDGLILEANKAAEDTFGYSVEEFRLLGRSGIMDMSDPNLNKFIKDRRESGYAKAVLTGIRKNGEHFPVEITSVMFNDSKDSEHTSVSMVDITERMKTEESLRRSEEQFRAAFEYSALGMSLVDLEGKLIKVNESFCKILGYTNKELLKLTLSEITYPDDVDKHLSLIEDVLNGTTLSYQLEKRYVNKNGKLTWVLQAGSVVHDIDHLPSHWTIQIQDITEQKNLEYSLKEERKLLHTLIENIPIGIYINNTESRKILVNKAECDFVGVSDPSEILGKNDYEQFPIALARISVAEDQEVFKSGKPIINREKTITCKDGTIRSILLSKIPLHDDGKITGLLGIKYDISKIKDTESALFESEQKFRNMFENIQDVFYQTDKDGIIIEISPSIKKHSGFARKELIGRRVDEFYIDIEERQLLLEALSEHRTVGDFEVQLKTKNGEKRYSSVNAQLIIRNGEVVGTEGSMRDVTERKLQEDSLKLLNSDLGLLNDQKNKLLSVIAHDLRNPISGCVALLEVVFMDIETTKREELIEYMTMMQKSILNAHELLEDLLEWARIQFHTVDFNVTSVSDLRGQVRHCLKKLDPIAEGKEIIITEDIEDGLKIRMDKYMLDSILRNLVTNAVKFTNKGGVIKVSAKRKGKGFTFSVSDNGIGIESRILETLFNDENGFTSYGTSGEKGTGMGLGLCRNFVEKHGGKIWADSKVGKGSTFYFTIPDQKDPS